MAPFFEPITLRPITVRNRIAVAPMFPKPAPHGIPYDDITAHCQHGTVPGGPVLAGKACGGEPFPLPYKFCREVLN